MTGLFAYINRYRGSKNKNLGYLMFIVAFLIPLTIVHPFFPLWQWIAIILTTIVTTLYIWKWKWGSHFWPSLGKEGDLKALTKLWRTKGIISFAILGIVLLDPITACIGYKLGNAGQIYFDELTPEAYDSIERAERRIGRLFEVMLYVPITVALLKTIVGI